MRRVKPNKSDDSMYFKNKNKKGSAEFFSSGCTLLDCILGGGWATSRIFNIVGDKSTAKTGLAIEAFANFQLKYPKGEMYFEEAEAAFDRHYGRKLGFPDAVDIMPFSETVEEVFDHLNKISTGKVPKLFILDSLDALSDKAEQSRGMDEGTYGMSKAKQMSTLFRKLRGQLARTNTTLGVISQVRDKISNVAFGKKQTRSGGRALDFYASQVVWLANLNKRHREVRKLKRAVGVNLKALCEKNKVGRPFRDCNFPYLFEYGVDDTIANSKFLKDHRVDVPLNCSDEELRNIVIELWEEIEEGFNPNRSKYDV